MKEENLIDHSIDIYFDNGFKVLIEYKIDENVDDYIQEDLKKHWENKEFWFPEATWDDCEIYINGNLVDELDMRRVIAVDYN